MTGPPANGNERAADRPPAIAVEELECRYGATTVLSGITFSVPEGELFFVIGGSGCGKTTLLRHLVGLMAPTRGAVRYFGENFTAASRAERRRLTRPSACSTRAARCGAP
jgi:phospholipid/cholesterol/gamma-HCH transport system ATP-binding protein